MTPPAALSEKGAAAYVAMSRPYLRRARREGHGPAFVRLGRTIRYAVADLDAWLNAHRVDRGRR